MSLVSIHYHLTLGGTVMPRVRPSAVQTWPDRLGMGTVPCESPVIEYDALCEDMARRMGYTVAGGTILRPRRRPEGRTIL